MVGRAHTHGRLGHGLKAGSGRVGDNPSGRTPPPGFLFSRGGGRSRAKLNIKRTICRQSARDRRAQDRFPPSGSLEYTLASSRRANSRERHEVLKYRFVCVGLICIFGFYPLTIIWPSGWSWHTGGHSDYLQMILGIYATLGVFLVIASRNPLAHRSLIWFTIWSSIVHGGIMAAQSVANTRYLGHLWGDVLALFVVAAVLGLLMPRGAGIRNV